MACIHHSCCNQEYLAYPTCSNPFTQDSRVNRLAFCPDPPYVSINDIINDTIVGPVDSYNVFVAEKLLSVVEEVGTSGYVRGYMVRSMLNPVHLYMYIMLIIKPILLLQYWVCIHIYYTKQKYLECDI